MTGGEIAGFDLSRPVIMGVLNVTPDSFSDGGRYAETQTAVARGLELAAQGADLVDIGGESTRPGATPVPRDQELQRVEPVITALAQRGVAVSIDTLHAATASAAVAAGARVINDVSGGLHDAEMLHVAARASRDHNARFIIGHWRGIPDPAHLRSEYADVVREVSDALAERARAAIEAGVSPEHIVLDPGLGFDKTGQQGWQLLAGLDTLSALGFPVLVGASRKRMLGEALAGVGSEERALTPDSAAHARDLATAVVSALAAETGAWGVRVHDVVGTRQALAVQRAWSGARTGEPEETHSTSARPNLVPSRQVAATAASVAGGAPQDRITLTGLEVFAHHGVFDFERERGQRFVVDAELTVDLAPAASGDSLERTVHYGELAEAISVAVAADPVDLIETVAERVAAVALGFAGVHTARITVHKPDAPIDLPFGDVSVTVVRERKRSEQR